MTDSVMAPGPPPVAPPPAPAAVPDRTHHARSAIEEGPDLGKIVIYHVVESPQNPAVDTPAIIQAVRDTDPVTVRLFVFGHGGPELVDDVVEGVRVGEWSALLTGPPPPPVVTALVPDTVVLGAPSFTLQVEGSGFTAQSVIVFAGHDEPTTVVSATALTTGVDMSLWRGPDAVPVTVRNADGQVSAPVSFTFTAAARAGTAREPTTEPPDPPMHKTRR